MVAVLLFTLGAGGVGLRGHQAHPPSAADRVRDRELRRAGAVFRPRGELVVGGARHLPEAQGLAQLLARGARQQGSAGLHGAVRGQRGADRHRHRRGRHIRRRPNRHFRARWRRLGADRRGAGDRGDPGGAREQGPADRRAGERPRRPIDCRSRPHRAWCRGCEPHPDHPPRARADRRRARSRVRR